jgi:multidrug resistance protein
VRNRSFLALCFLVLVNQMGFGVITPVLPSYARSFGLSGGAVGLVIGSYGLARFLANVPAGHLAERQGRRRVIILGTAITSIAAALIATATSLTLLLVYRLLAGLGAATVLTAGEIMVGDIATPENRGRMMSLYQGFFLVGVGLGPAPGGFLYDHMGIRAPFIAYAVFSALACGLALMFIRETQPGAVANHAHDDAQDATVPAEVPSARSVILSPAFILIGAISFAQFWGRTGALFTVVPLMGKDRLGLSASAVGVALSVVNLLNIATLYHAGSLSDRFGRKWVIVPATLISGLSLTTFAVGGAVHGSPAFCEVCSRIPSAAGPKGRQPSFRTPGVMAGSVTARVPVAIPPPRAADRTRARVPVAARCGAPGCAKSQESAGSGTRPRPSAVRQ